MPSSLSSGTHRHLSLPSQLLLSLPSQLLPSLLAVVVSWCPVGLSACHPYLGTMGHPYLGAMGHPYLGTMGHPYLGAMVVVAVCLSSVVVCRHHRPRCPSHGRCQHRDRGDRDPGLFGRCPTETPWWSTQSMTCEVDNIDDDPELILCPKVTVIVIMTAVTTATATTTATAAAQQPA